MTVQDSGHMDDGGRLHVVLSAVFSSLPLFSSWLHKHEPRGAENPAAVQIHGPDCTAEKVFCSWVLTPPLGLYVPFLCYTA